ncbi:ATP synthase subunit f, mitochondrial-like isoform X1 [Acanthaster planci]|uniref:ATP synthase subunit f, mitochondrial-like isoform X1 n=1 Tax=Acanthaster planci TaxID=133434 RepID=A0A8B7YIP9_ACAPL|nr:ATP synthase subunit f, mitochondrial-like isoform X1 [Acanthaster planci]
MKRHAVSELRLSEVKLGQLPRWLASCSFSPFSMWGAVIRGKNRYYHKYVNVRKTGVAPVGQFVAVCIIVSYIWRYKGEKHHRLRKHHW